ncbi:MAG: DNA polymerase III subunit gamma/tau, partial [Anaerovoracaceae bacterium]|nr:DNA polymerase III subunit gamma/tau [Anaerovoracaceae bacterium]
MYKALYRRYRPETFDEVIGQDHIVKVLKNQIEQDSVSHAYLFCGTRGTGKTTMARLLAKGVNCLADSGRPCGKCENCIDIQNGSFVDLIEIDAASNRGIDDIRSLRESVNYAPSVGRRKVFIIDEVHMLTKEADNALLKTIEEPPENVIFILCTTEPDSLLPTILSRCIRFDFKCMPEDVLQERMQYICDDLGVQMDGEALHMIAVQADGSARDGLTLLDQCIAGRSGHISLEDVLESLGAVSVEQYLELTDKIIRRDVAGGLMLIDGMIRAGRDARQILQGLMTHY